MARIDHVLLSIHQESEGQKTENSEGAAPSPSPALEWLTS